MAKCKQIKLTRLIKTSGGRNINTDSLVTFCQNNKQVRPIGWLVATNTLKTPESENIFGHVLKAIMDKQQVVIKLYESDDGMLDIELKVLKYLTHKNVNNIIKYSTEWNRNQQSNCRKNHLEDDILWWWIQTTR